ncbi:MAG: PHD finger domain-containing protein [Candidatus Hodarchaeota archaeon]
MVNFSGEDWLMALSTIAILVFGYSVGAFFFYKSRKAKIRLLTLYSLFTVFAISGWLPIVIEFLSVLITNTSIDRKFYATMMWIPPNIAGFLLYYIAAKLLTPKKKWIVICYAFVWHSFHIINTIIAQLEDYVFIGPPDVGFIHKAGLNPTSLASFLGLLGFIIQIIFVGFGFLVKSFKSKGILRKKYFYLSIASFLILGFGMFDSFAVGTALILSRIGVVSNSIFAYLGLREEPEKIKVKPAEKEIKIEDSIFRIRKRPAQITEEEVTYYKEQKICLICKGAVGGFNTYICTGCDALYHEDCARALSGMENACWACNEPIDKSKPSKSFKIEEAEAGFKKPEKIKD